MADGGTAGPGGNTKWVTGLVGVGSAAAGALTTALIQAAQQEPIWLVVLVLAALLAALIVALAATWLGGSWVHIREHARIVAQLVEERAAHARERVAMREEFRGVVNEWKARHDQVLRMLGAATGTTERVLVLTEQAVKSPPVDDGGNGDGTEAAL